MAKSSLISLIIEDIKCNPHAKSKFVLTLYRIAFASGASSSSIIRWLTIPLRIAYRIVVDWLMGIDIPAKVRIGRRPVLYHGIALVINEAVVIGDDCILRHCVTIGNKLAEDGESAAPLIGDRVEFGAGALVIGPVVIGDDAKIGAGSVVTKSVAPGAIVVGSPGRDIRTSRE